MNKARVTESDFGLRGMDVNVDLGRRQLEKDERHGEDRGWQHVPVGLRDSVQNKAVAYQPAVHKKIDAVAVEFLYLRSGHKPPKPHRNRLTGILLLRRTPKRRDRHPAFHRGYLD